MPPSIPYPLSPAQLGLTPATFRRRALAWANNYACCAYYAPTADFAGPGGPFAELLAVAAAPGAAGPASLAELESWLKTSTGAPRCGILSYDLKNEIEALRSDHPDHLEWPALHFFEAASWLRWTADEAIEFHGSPQALAALLAATSQPDLPEEPPAGPTLRARLPPADYLNAVRQVQQDILNGEVYELNLCQEFFAENVTLDPVAAFWRLQAAAPAPFAGFYKCQQRYLLGASPERFVQRRGDELLSQPIKGTIARGPTPLADADARERLRNDPKEQAENLMIVDLVRNDLARVARTGSVRVPELFGLYPFRHVWQMISSVTATARPGLGLADVLRAAFPMGSMTGAPKIRAMQLIEKYERSRRGLYSGSLGVVWPTGDFDFNVVIRSLYYRADSGYLSLQVGSAITYDAVPEREYEECLLKARGVLEALGAVIETE
ncbi:anthranilate synthase component I family protein [uncultured Hymenobacter sp.]|uniref:anthranilate synthase component I family protein n=1 Tax=uncultured Hymenobacter sp. TaxID=170016 RepID=UPI0035CC72EF